MKRKGYQAYCGHGQMWPMSGLHTQLQNVWQEETIKKSDILQI